VEADSIEVDKKKKRFSPSICLTHDCNLDCVYCYQKHDSSTRMAIETAKKSVEWIFQHVPDGFTEVELSFIGGEPLLEFELMKEVYEFIQELNPNIPYILYATTNGTLLDNKMKEWFTLHKKQFWLGLSLDGTKKTHDLNRSNSFDKIDIEYFRNTWPDQGVKMTLTENSLLNLSDNIIFLHSLGFKEIGGVNLFEGEYNWDDEKYIKMLVPELTKLVNFYVENNDLKLNQMFDKRLELCAMKSTVQKKWCGIGNGVLFFDVDGEKYPCSFVTPMTFSNNDLLDISKVDFENDDNFIDSDCLNNCYIYPICPTCYGSSYMNYKSFKKRNKSKCNIEKLVSLFVADLHAKRIKKNSSDYDVTKLYYTIEAIENIRDKYLNEFKKYLNF